MSKTRQNWKKPEKDGNNVVEEFLRQNIPDNCDEYIVPDQDSFAQAHEHFRKLEQEEAHLLGEIANIRFIG